MASKRAARGILLDDVLRREMKDPEFRNAFEQRALVHEVAIAVRRMREAAELTQAQLAKLIGVSQPMVARVERGSDRRTPSWDTLRRIARALGRHLTVAFVESGKPRPLVTIDGRAAGGVLRHRQPRRGVESEQLGPGPA